MKSATNRHFCPRLSDARHVLPLIRGQLAAAASRRPLATALDLLPIVEDGLFGYEIVPDGETHTYPIIGCNDRGEPVLRKTSYCTGAPGALQLVAVNGRLLSRSERAARYSIQRRDAVFPSWVAAAEQLLAMFPEGPRQSPVLHENVHGWLDQALSLAHTHLVHWDPFIQFFGLPNEAQLGFALAGANGEHGELIFHEPDTWTLRWNAPPEVVNASWSVVAAASAPGKGSVHGERFPDRRMHFRRATDRGGIPVPWVGNDRRQARGRRAMERRA